MTYHPGYKPDRLTREKILYLRDVEKRTVKWIAEEYGYSESHVSALGGAHASPAALRLREFYPLQVPTAFQRSRPHVNTRNHFRYVIAPDELIPNLKERRQLRHFYMELVRTNTIVEFNPEFPPTDRNKKGGFRFQKRVERDEDYVIRINEFVVPRLLTDLTFYELNRIPPENKWPADY